MLFNTNIRVVYIMLGDKCNFQCRYCIQGDKAEELRSLPECLTPSVLSFLRNLCTSQKQKPTLLFYGGEPLLYFDKIKTIMEATAPVGANFNMITNGSLITDEIVEFFNDHGAQITVSWDGSASIDTRKKDVFNDPELKARIFKINKLGINSVISAKSYPLQACQDVQRLLTEYKQQNSDGLISINFDEIIDNDLHDRDLIDFDYAKLETEVHEIIRRNKDWIQSCKTPSGDIRRNYTVMFDEHFTERGFLFRYIDCIHTYQTRNCSENCISPCKDGLCRLGIDMAGNLYSCHDSRDILGNIRNLDLATYVTNYIKLDNTKQLYDTLCKNCEWYPVCCGRCKLLSVEARINTTCKIKQAIGRPLLAALYG